MGYFIAAMVLFGFLFSGITFWNKTPDRTISGAPPRSSSPVASPSRSPSASPSISPSPSPGGAFIPGVAH